jgi:hypothetical protein
LPLEFQERRELGQAISPGRMARIAVGEVLQCPAPAAEGPPIAASFN